MTETAANVDVSSATTLFDAVEAEGKHVSVTERLGDALANEAHHGDAHKWLVVAWRQMEAAAAPSSCVRYGDKGAGLAAHAEWCASYIGDILIQTDDGKEIIEIKNYTPFVTRSTACPAVCTLNGGQYLGGNTEERLKYTACLARGAAACRRSARTTTPTALATSPPTAANTTTASRTARRGSTW